MNKILIANRGEIALRVMRTAKEMGIQTVAIFSDADRHMPFVKFADEAVHIGPSPSAQSYLRADKILEIARSLSVDAIHPGYGFLSENAEFSQAVSDAGLTFVGPSAHSIRMMGSKIAAKQTAKQFNVPLVPGTEDPVKTLEEAKAVVAQIGYPILIKASAGGGGKGMRLVFEEAELEQQMAMAKSEALSAFSNDDVFIEKYVAAPRHIEIQILRDRYGNGVYLFERECSIQRRHQKLIEEAPSKVVSEEMRKAMGECALAIADACNYEGAGTIEFLVDEQLNFYFLEMNTRLQVEHCVTEMITGIDLVREQINIARGEKLSFTQADLKINGHAIELRVCAEDPNNNFLPDTGKLTTYRPAKGPGVRVDDGFEEGSEVPVFYDSMLAKLIVHAANREQAIQRLVRAIDEYEVGGVNTTLAFGKWAVQTEAFRTGAFDTKFIDNYFKPEHLIDVNDNTLSNLALTAGVIWEEESKQAPLQIQTQQSEQQSQWKTRRKQ